MIREIFWSTVGLLKNWCKFEWSPPRIWRGREEGTHQWSINVLSVAEYSIISNQSPHFLSFHKTHQTKFFPTEGEGRYPRGGIKRKWEFYWMPPLSISHCCVSHPRLCDQWRQWSFLLDKQIIFLISKGYTLNVLANIIYSGVHSNCHQFGLFVPLMAD